LRFFLSCDASVTGVYTLSLHDALPISRGGVDREASRSRGALFRLRPPLPCEARAPGDLQGPFQQGRDALRPRGLRRGAAVRSYRDRKSTRLNSSHLVISYAVFCLKKKK